MKRALILLATLSAVSTMAQAQVRAPLMVVTPYSAGGGTSTMARLVCETLQNQLNRPCIVDHKPGAGTAIGNAAVAHAAPDGNTLLLTTSAFTIVSVLGSGAELSKPSDFTYVAHLGTTPNVFTVNENSRFKSGQALVDQIKAGGTPVTYGSAGIGTTTHISGEMLSIILDKELNHIPYKGANPLLSDLLGGHVEVAVTSLTSAMPQVSKGSVKPLAVTTAERSSALPDVPTLRELGVKDYEVTVWYGVFAPKGMSPQATAQIYAALKGLQQDNRFMVWAKQQGVDYALKDGQYLEQVVKSDLAKWEKLKSRLQ